MKKVKFFLIFIVSLCLIVTAYPSVVQAGPPKIPNRIEIGVGGSKTIPCDLSNCRGKRKNWSATGNHITITSGGTLKAVSVGEGNVIVSTEVEGEKSLCKVVVKPAAKISLSNSSISLARGKTKTISVSFKNSGSSKIVHWSSSNTSVATVSSNGVVTAKNIGRAVITCESGDCTGESKSCTVNVIKNTTTTKKQTTAKKRTTKKKKKKQGSSPATKKEATATTSSYNGPIYYESEETTYESEYERRERVAASNAGKVTEPTTTKQKETTTTMVYKVVEDGETTSVALNEEELTENNYNEQESFIVQPYKISGVSKKRKPVVVSWDQINGVDGYELYCSTDGKTFTLIYDGTNHKYEQHLFENGKTYYYLVRSYRYSNGLKIKDMPSKVLSLKTVQKGILQKLFGG